MYGQEFMMVPMEVEWKWGGSRVEKDLQSEVEWKWTFRMEVSWI